MTNFDTTTTTVFCRQVRLFVVLLSSLLICCCVACLNVGSTAMMDEEDCPIAIVLQVCQCLSPIKLCCNTSLSSVHVNAGIICHFCWFLIHASPLCQIICLVILALKCMIGNCNKMRIIHDFVKIVVEIADCLAVGSSKMNNCNTPRLIPTLILNKCHCNRHM